ncbi:pyridoxamine 5'-phosphate oxidase family protein [Salinicoccus sp. ID82-1]|uniref:pyridoxamine 5'-phosphate oxidase family protein n=1 Tax=Salinicoccus sp. ID82-1 TaxID=2820269 RepID=UPI001F32FCBA|nr:pyridoxamine 5'-phosphate oxidase family protein [Salinicoccus sp. ID82-1]MCG1008533.1 pyridoxamine 5'-phosphate oxidase family protein [Salinicoccus sp. ID82-1]
MSQGERKLQSQFGTERRAAAFYRNQMLDHVNTDMADFISEQEMVFVATSDSGGNCDNTFRAGDPGFVRVLDAYTLLYPEYRGNGVMASLGNIRENPHIGLMFIDFYTHHIGLHVNGTAEIVENEALSSLGIDDDTLLRMHQEENGRAERWVVIRVDEAYIHCSKHIPHLVKKSETVDWGTDDEKKKGGDFFNVKRRK